MMNNRFFLGTEEYELNSDEIIQQPADFESSIAEYAKFFLNAPYLWGGKTLFGIDCSGFTQVVFKMLGKNLKRDAWQQAEQGEIVNFLQEAKAGDLAFFDNAEGHVIHVGIMLNEQQIIHASGRVKIDPIDGQGIYSLDLKKHTHKLRIIKRV
jgi:cell wall-associated NlpC family hydrolase